VFSLLDDGTMSQYRLPVVAWAIDASSPIAAQPICFDDYDFHMSESCLETENSWVFPWVAHFDTLNDAAAYAREQLQAKKAAFGKEQAQKAATA
jgi:hypothetical protein